MVNELIKDASWIIPEWTVSGDNDCPLFIKKIKLDKGYVKAFISLTAAGVYYAKVNGKDIGRFFMAPGWTNYSKRLQYQTYDITELLHEGDNIFEIIVGNGWFRGKIAGFACKLNYPAALISEIVINYPDKKEYIYTDKSWNVKKSKIRFSDIYDGEIYDACFESDEYDVLVSDKINKNTLILQEGEIVCEHERIAPVRDFITPKGERVLDFGQEITGIVEFCTDAEKNQTVELSFAEVLDKEWNFYNDNYRSAKCIYKYICKRGKQSYKPKTTFYGFRYVRVDSAPENTDFYAIVIYSDIKRSGYLKTEHEKLNKLFENIVWSQKCNFLDVPTDCPQRDERLGWTGDAQVFCKTAMYQFDTKKFFVKWLNDMKSTQRENGKIPQTVPEKFSPDNPASAAWGDAAVIIPWTLYEMYGDLSVLKQFFPMMYGWIKYIENNSTEKNLWTGHFGFGDWLALDSNNGDYKGVSDTNFISSAFYKYSVSIVKKAAKELGYNYKIFEKKENDIRDAFIKRFPQCHTQTEYALALYFDLTDKKAEFAKDLVSLICLNQCMLKTGFVGTPYILFALSENGYSHLAYTLLLREEYPSWLYSVNKGATTIWEHWDGIKQNGTFWSADMNSFNHYAYGAVAQWIFSVAAGIVIDESGLKIRPVPDKRLGSLSAEYDSRFGKIKTHWHYEGNETVYEITVPIDCLVTIDGEEIKVRRGKHTF